MTSARKRSAGSTSRPAGGAAGFDSGLSEALVRTSRFFRKGDVSADLRSLHQIGGRDADSFYRDRWSHDKVVSYLVLRDAPGTRTPASSPEGTANLRPERSTGVRTSGRPAAATATGFIKGGHHAV